MSREPSVKRLLLIQLVVGSAAIAVTGVAGLGVPKLLKQRDALAIEIRTETRKLVILRAATAQALTDLEDLRNRTADKALAEQAGDIAFDLATALPATSEPSVREEPMQVLFDRLFSATAKKRVDAYNELISGYGKEPSLVPALMLYASAHADNRNGVYNTLVVLSHVDHDKLGSDKLAVREFAESVRKAEMPKTNVRIDKLLSRLE